MHLTPIGFAVLPLVVDRENGIGIIQSPSPLAPGCTETIWISILRTLVGSGCELHKVIMEYSIINVEVFRHGRPEQLLCGVDEQLIQLVGCKCGQIGCKICSQLRSQINLVVPNVGRNELPFRRLVVIEIIEVGITGLGNPVLIARTAIFSCSIVQFGKCSIERSDTIIANIYSVIGLHF